MIDNRDRKREGEVRIEHGTLEHQKRLVLL